jgi:hypothetical protein
LFYPYFLHKQDEFVSRISFLVNPFRLLSPWLCASIRGYAGVARWMGIEVMPGMIFFSETSEKQENLYY